MSILTIRVVITALYSVAFLPLIPLILFSPFLFSFAFDDPNANIALRLLLILVVALCIISLPASVVLVWIHTPKWALIGIPGLLLSAYALFFLKDVHTPTEYSDIALNAEFGNLAAVERQLAEGASPDGSSDGKSPLIVACLSGHFIIAEKLIDAGADVFAYDSLGWTAGTWVAQSTITDGPEGEARVRVMEKMKAKGFPFPPPSQEEIQERISRGTWPPEST